MTNMIPEFEIAFFGSSAFSLYVLEALKQLGVKPALIVSTPASPKGRRLIVTPSAVTAWAHEQNIQTLTPQTLADKKFIKELKKSSANLYIVASYGKKIPKDILDLPKYKTLNIHPSLLPKWRGPSPIQESLIAGEKETGITIIEMDEMIDHGRIVARQILAKDISDMYYGELEKELGNLGGKLMAHILPDWIQGRIKTNAQNELEATYTKKISKEDGLIMLDADPKLNYRKVRAYEAWPKTYFFAERDGKKIKVIITKARLEDNRLLIERVIPEGKKEMDYEAFERGLKIPTVIVPLP